MVDGKPIIVPFGTQHDFNLNVPANLQLATKHKFIAPTEYCLKFEIGPRLYSVLFLMIVAYFLKQPTNYAWATIDVSSVWGWSQEIPLVLFTFCILCVLVYLIYCVIISIKKLIT